MLMLKKRMEQLKQQYIVEDGPYMGRFGKAARKGYFLKKAKKRKLFVKEISLTSKQARREFTMEAEANEKCTIPFPTKCLKTWEEDKKGFILSKYKENVGWQNLPQKYGEKAIKSIVKQLKHIHSCGYSHGDLAPKNLLVDKLGNTSIIDFEDVKPLTRKSEQMDWSTLQSYFYPYGKHTPKDILFFNYLQRAIPNDGYVLEIDSLQHGESNKGYAFVLVHNNKKVGRVFFISRKTGKWKQYIYIDNVIIYPSFRYKGMCYKMIHRLQEFLVSHGQRLYLKVEKNNLANIQCFQKAGFKVDTKNSTKAKYTMIHT
jgi:serine/threonine protein kinase